MANFTGTDGDDTLNGTGKDDTFDPKLGVDFVHGNAGMDLLRIDYSSVQSYPHGAQYIRSDPANGFSGTVFAGNNAVFFDGIESIAYKGSQDADDIRIDAAALSLGGSLNIDGGANQDALDVDFSKFAGTTFVATGAGAVTSNRGTYSNFETYTVRLGGGTNKVSTYGGDDSVFSKGGVDTIDGGGGVNGWTGDYSATTSKLSFSDVTNKLSNGTTLANIARYTLTTGSGDDSFTLTGRDGSGLYGTVLINAGAGYDSLNLNFNSSGLPAAQVAISSSASGNGFSVFATPAPQYQPYNFFYNTINDLESAKITGTSGNDIFAVDANALAPGDKLSVDGGAYSDLLSLYAVGLNNTDFAVSADGTITSNRGSYASFEQFQIRLGGGTNHVTTGALDDRVYTVAGSTNVINTGDGGDSVISVGSVDTVDGGAGNDFWEGAYDGTTSALSFSDATGRLSNGTSITGIENYKVTTGSGDDSFTLSNGSLTARVDGYSGTDSLSYDLSTYATPVRFTIADGGGYSLHIDAFDGARQTLTADRVEHVTLTGTAGDDLFRIQSLPPSGNIQLNLDGGPGVDKLQANFYTIDAGSTFMDDGTGVVTSDRGSFSHFELYDLTGSGGPDTFTGGAGDDVLHGAGGNDTLGGGAGDDTIDGGADSDTASYAGAAAAVTVGLALEGQAQDTKGAGQDTLTGIENLTGSGYNDTLTGDGGANVLDGGGGKDRLTGGAGDDTYVVRNAGVILTETDDGGTDTVRTAITYTLAKNFENLELLAGAKNGTGNAADNMITGNDGENRLSGRAGADTLIGGGGKDVLTGGDGGDTFRLTALADSTVDSGGRDVITDFSQAEHDRLDLRPLESGQPFTFVGDAPFSHSVGEVHYAFVRGDTVVSGDVDGNGVADFSILLRGEHVALTLADLQI